MNYNAIQRAIVEKLYRARFETPEQRSYNMHDFANEKGIDPDVLWRNWEHLERRGVVETVDVSMDGEITDFGVREAERLGIAPKDLVQQNVRIRKAILKAFTKLFDGKGEMPFIGVNEVEKGAGVTQSQFDANISLLDVEFMVGSVRLTPRGWFEAQRS